MLHKMNVDGADDTRTDGKDAVTCAELTKWFAELRDLAARRNLSCLIGEIESHGAAYVDGLTPEQELQEQIDAALNG